MPDTSERDRLANLESAVGLGQCSFIQVGSALREIRDAKLYISVLNYTTFENYCEERWDIVRSRAYQIIEAATVVERVQNFGHGDLLVIESQARELAKLPADQQAEAWQEIVENCEGQRITAADVAEVVERRLLGLPASGSPIVHIEPLEGVVDSLDGLIADGAKFGTVYADPPWQYENSATRANVEGHYAGTMMVDEICAMPISLLAADDAHLHLWTTNAFLLDAFRVMKAWGFEYRSVFVWVKPQMGIGNYWRVSHEFMLLGIRGNAKRFNEHCHKSWLEIERSRHSAKPDAVRGIIERVSPGPYIELFGREQITGWTVFGNQVNAQERFA